MKVLGIALIGEVIILTIFDILVIGQGGGSTGTRVELAEPRQCVRQRDRHRRGRGGAGRRRRRRHLLRVLVVGRLRGGPELRGGVEEPGEERAARDAARASPASACCYVITSLRVRLGVPVEPAGRGRAEARGRSSLRCSEFGTHGLATIMQILILTGSFACAMAFHNIAMRYFYAMGREGVLPRVARQDAPQRTPSPYVASVVQTGRRRRDRARLGHRRGLRQSHGRRLRPRLHDDGRAGRGLASSRSRRSARSRSSCTSGKHKELRLEPARRDRLPDHRDRRPGVRDLPAVQEHPRDRRHDQLRRPDRVDRDRRRGGRGSPTRSTSRRPTARSTT